MNQLTIVILSLILILGILQIFNVITFIFSWQSNFKNQYNLEEIKELPKAAIVLALRGADPFLPACIEALLKQNYPDYTLKIIIDSSDDPAKKIIDRVIEKTKASHLEVSELITKYKTCSLKCSSLIQAVSELDESYEVVAFIDADVVAPPHWLRELVAPLSDEKIGASSGLRWHSLQTNKLSSFIRTIWNKSGSIYMYRNQIAWGGSMALKRSILEQAKVLETWQNSLSVDTPITKLLKQMNLQIKFAPSLIMVNSEESELSGCIRFITRQLLVARLYRCSPFEWIIGLIFNCAYFLSIFVGLFLLLNNIFNANLMMTLYLFMALISYIISTVVLMVFLERSIYTKISSKQEPISYFSALTNLKILIAVPLVELLTVWTMILATFKQSVDWRGVSYKFTDALKVQLVEYRPYKVSNQSNDSKISVF